MKNPGLLRMPFALAAFCAMGLVCAQDSRDPTRPPSTVAASPGASAAPAELGSSGFTVIVRNGKPFLAVGTRLYAPGQKIGALKLERITETEIWLLDGKELRKIPRFPGIQRKTSAQP